MIASRRSDLARAQAERVGAALGKLHPTLNVQFRWIESQGDRLMDRPLHDVGGKGLFTREVDRVLLDQKADLAVHSLKDLPAGDTPGLAIAAIPKRHDPRDVLVSAERFASIHDLPEGAVVGTSSPRRKAQLLRLRPDLQIELLRGNVPTRIERVLDPESAYQATLMAAAGLKRLKLQEHLDHPVATDTVLPAACQGALALVCRSDDHVTLTRCLPLNHSVSAAEVHAERQLLRILRADCHTPVAVFAEQTEPDRFRLRAEVLSADGGRHIAIDETATARSLRKVVRAAGQKLLDQGADEILGHRPNLDDPAYRVD